MEWSWCRAGEIHKLLGVPFGVSLESKDSDLFLWNRLENILKYWCGTRINSMRRTQIVNSVLTNSCLYFLATWEGSKRGIQKTTRLIRNYMWRNQREVVKAWNICCRPKCDGGLNLVDPEMAHTALIGKWIISTCLPGSSPLQALLRYRLMNFQPCTASGLLP